MIYRIELDLHFLLYHNTNCVGQVSRLGWFRISSFLEENVRILGLASSTFRFSGTGQLTRDPQLVRKTLTAFFLAAFSSWIEISLGFMQPNLVYVSLTLEIQSAWIRIMSDLQIVHVHGIASMAYHNHTLNCLTVTSFTNCCNSFNFHTGNHGVHIANPHRCCIQTNHTFAPQQCMRYRPESM